MKKVFHSFVYAVIFIGSFNPAAFSQTDTGYGIEETSFESLDQQPEGVASDSIQSNSRTTQENAYDTAPAVTSDSARQPGAVTLEKTVPAENPDDDQEPIVRRQKRSGMGLNIGFRFFYPVEVNNLIEDIWEEMKSGGITTREIGSQALFLATSLKLKGILYIGTFFCIEPYGQFLWAPKQLSISGAVSRKTSTNLFDFSGGLNFWFKVSPQKRVSFKCGLGGFGGYSMLDISGYVGDTRLSGAGYGGNVLAGIDICLKKVAVNIDFIVPIGFSDFTTRDGDLDADNAETWKYPSKLAQTGFEFRPGITFHF